LRKKTRASSASSFASEEAANIQSIVHVFFIKETPRHALSTTMRAHLEVVRRELHDVGRRSEERCLKVGPVEMFFFSKRHEETLQPLPWRRRRFLPKREARLGSESASLSFFVKRSVAKAFTVRVSTGMKGNGPGQKWRFKDDGVTCRRRSERRKRSFSALSAPATIDFHFSFFDFVFTIP
jgi:hypothetical protein